jgi:hypothetical protein
VQVSRKKQEDADRPRDARENQLIPETPSTSGTQFPPREGALKLLQQAETHLNEAARVYAGERVTALNGTNAATGFKRDSKQLTSSG